MAKKFDINMKRVVGFAGHAGSGKTTICESILYLTKTVDRLGRVATGQSNMDFEPEEQKRLYSVSASFQDVVYKNNQIFIADTPGLSDFYGDAVSVCSQMGTVILTVDAVAGIKFNTERLYDFLAERKSPMIFFVNKLDEEQANFDKAVKSISESIGTEPVVLQIPIGVGPGLKGIVDILEQKAYIYSDESGKSTVADVPADLAGKVAEMRDAAIERLVEGNDEVMMKYLDGEEVSDDEVKSCLMSGTASGAFIPLFCGAAYKNIGTDRLLDMILACVPSPDKEPAREMINPDGEKKSLSISEEGGFTGYVIKTIADPFAGIINVVRILSGKIKFDDTILCVRTQDKERLGKPFYMKGKDHPEIEEGCAGDIVGVSKLKDVETGDTLTSDLSSKFAIPRVAMPAAMVTYSVYAKGKGEEDKIGAAFRRVTEEDPSLKFYREEQTKEFLFAGLGQTHIDVTLEKIKRKFKLEVDLREPKIPYRETIRGSADVQGKYKKQTGGRGQYGDCHMRVSPLPRGEGFKFVNSVVGGVIPKQYIPAIEKGVVEAMEHGELTGNPVQDVQVDVYFGSYHAVDSSEMAFKMAGSMAWKKAMTESSPILLEPVYKVRIYVPSDFVGGMYGNVSSRRGRVLGSDNMGRLEVVNAEIPLAELHGLSPDLRAMTGDRGFFEAEFLRYEEVPSNIVEKVVEAYKKTQEEEAKE